MPSNSTELLGEGGGTQSEAEKCKFDGTSTHLTERGIKTLFDAQLEQLGNLDSKNPDGAAIYSAWL